MTTLIIAEHDNHRLNPVTLNVVKAGQSIGSEIDLLVAGHHCREVAEQAAVLPSIRKILMVDQSWLEHPLAEDMAAVIDSLADNYSHILAASTSHGKDFMPRVAALRGVDQISDVISVESPQVFRRPIYAGNAIARIEASALIHVLTVRTSAFEAIDADSGCAQIEEVAQVPPPTSAVRFVSEVLSSGERPELASARVIVSGGRALQTAENFSLLNKLADKLGAAVGASRAAVDSGFAPNDLQIGQTGKIVAPDLYIAVGISGAIQHLAGMKDSKVIVAINKDEDAPIFQAADYGLVGDLFEVMPELIEQV